MIGQVIKLNGERYIVVEQERIPGLYKNGWFCRRMKDGKWAYWDG